MRKRQKAIRYYYYCGPLPWSQRWPAVRIARYFFTFLIGVVAGVALVILSANPLAGIYADVFETGRLAPVSTTPASSASSVR